MTAGFYTVITPAIVYYLHRTAKAVAKATNTELSDGFLKQLEALARFGISYAQEQTNKLLKGLIIDGPRTGEEKKAIAVHAMKSIAPPGIKFTDEQAGMAIEATISRTRSLAPPAALPSVPPGTMYQSVNPPPATLPPPPRKPMP